MAQPATRTGRFVYADYLTWPDDERWEVIEGTAYNMSPAPSRRHQDVSGELLVQLKQQLRGSECRVYAAPFDVRLPAGDEADDEVETVVQPDLAVIRDPRKLDKTGCRGAPDLMIEILSPATAYKDQTTKLALYQSRGVREYWIVNPDSDIVFVHRLGAGGAYAKPEVYRTGETVELSALPGLSIDLAETFRP